MSPGRSAVAQKIFFATASTLSHNKCICIFVKREKTSEKATLFKLVLKMSRSAVFFSGAPRRTRTLDNRSEVDCDIHFTIGA